MSDATQHSSPDRSDLRRDDAHIEKIAREIAPYTGAINVICGEVASYYSGFNLSEFARRLLASQPSAPAQGAVPCGAGLPANVVEALTLGRDAVMESFYHADTKDDHMIAEMRIRSIEAVLSALPPQERQP